MIEKTDNAAYSPAAGLSDRCKTIQDLPSPGETTGFKSMAIAGRIIEILFSLILLLLFLPLMLLIAAIIRWDSPGNVIFAAPRLGLRGKEFTCYKFRSMYGSNEVPLQDYFTANPAWECEWLHYAKLKNQDPRITRSGRWLRKSSLDELPQLINILKGDMSFIGPRPYMPRERPTMGPYADVILSIKPGLTGLWQVSGRSDLNFQQRLMLDHYYVKKHSIMLDIIILIKTIPAVILCKGAY